MSSMLRFATDAVQSVPGGLATVVVAAWACWYVTTAATAWWRLRHIPGPTLASFSYLWLGRVALSGRQDELYGQLHGRYGGAALVRVGPAELTTDRAEVLRRLSGAKSSYGRGAWYDGNRFNPYHPTMFMLQDPGEHDRRKARLAPGYSGRDTGGVEACVDAMLRVLVDLVRGKYLPTSSTPPPPPPLDLASLSGLFTLDVISLLALGEEFGCVREDRDVTGFYEAIHDYLPQMTVSCDVPWVRRIAYSPLFLRCFGPRETDSSGLGRTMRIVNDIVRQRFAPDAKDQKDMLGSFVRHGLTQAECEVEALFMFIAGSDTTAAVIRITMLHIISNPVVYGRLKAEIAAAVKEGRVSSPITNAESRSLPYLQAVIYEGLRIRPVALGLMPKLVPPEGDTIDGVFVPGGTSIGMNSAAMLRSRAVFGDDADLFRPDRFLRLDEAARADLQREVEMTFGYGRWMCAGKPVALMELNKIYFELLRHFDFQLLNPRNPMDSSCYILYRDADLLVSVTAADDAAL